MVALVSALLLMAAFGMADRIIFFLQLAFVLSAGSALWCAVSKNNFTEYAVWTMYLTGFALMVLMFLRFLPRRPTKAKRRTKSDEVQETHEVKEIDRDR